MSKEKETQKESEPAVEEKESRSLKDRLLKFQTARIIVQLVLFVLFNAAFFGLGP